MNPILAQLYGLDKTASDAQAQPEGGEEGEIDLSQYTAAQLIEALQAVEEEDAAESEKVAMEKMASSGELDYWVNAGRALAHGFADGAEKLASADDGLPDEISLDEINGAELAELLESGEYELVQGDDVEKTAGARFQAAKEALKRGAGKAAAGGRRAGELLSAKHVRGNVREVAGAGASAKGKAKAYAGIIRGKAGNSMMTSEARKSLAAQGGAGAAGAGGVTGAIAALRNRRKK